MVHPLGQKIRFKLFDYFTKSSYLIVIILVLFIFIQIFYYGYYSTVILRLLVFINYIVASGTGGQSINIISEMVQDTS